MLSDYNEIPRVPSIYQLKPAFQALLRPLVRQLFAWKVTPNQVTCAALFLSLGTGAFLFFHRSDFRSLLILPPVLLLRMALNAIDGMLAREFHLETRMGAVLNEAGDVLSDGALYLPLAFVAGSAVLVVIAVFLALVTEMVGVLGRVRRYDGPMGKSDRAVVFGVAALSLGLGVSPGIWFDALMAITVVLSILTIVNRGMHVAREAA